MKCVYNSLRNLLLLINSTVYENNNESDKSSHQIPSSPESAQEVFTYFVYYFVYMQTVYVVNYVFTIRTCRSITILLNKSLIIALLVVSSLRYFQPFKNTYMNKIRKGYLCKLRVL